MRDYQNTCVVYERTYLTKKYYERGEAKSLRGVEFKNENKLNFFNFPFILAKTYSRNIF